MSDTKTPKHGTGIEWTKRPGTRGETLNPIRARNRETGKLGWFCIHANPDCINCYAETLNVKGGDSGGNGIAYKAQLVDRVEISLDEDRVTQPLRWRQPRTIFLCSMTDLFVDFVPFPWIDRVFAVAALAPQHTYIILTKRPKRMRDYFNGTPQPRWMAAMREIAPPADSRGVPLDTKNGALPNVWLGTSCGTQKTADEFIPDLLATPAAVRFVSVEPMTGPVDLYNGDPDPRLGGHQATQTFLGEWWEPGAAKNSPPHHGLDWVICGGESGPKARPMHPEWARSLRDQCAAADVPFFFKQWGEWAPGENSDRAQTRTERTASWSVDAWTFENITASYSQEMHADDEPDLWRLGKKQAGRMLDGRTHDEFPLVRGCRT